MATSKGSKGIKSTAPAPPVRLSDEQVQEALKACPEWSESGEAIQRTFAFKDFVAAMAFVGRVAQLAERVQHHPDILIRYNKVTFTLSTHDAGGLTARDFDLAAQIDALAGADQP